MLHNWKIKEEVIKKNIILSSAEQINHCLAQLISECMMVFSYPHVSSSDITSHIKTLVSLDCIKWIFWLVIKSFICGMVLP